MNRKIDFDILESLRGLAALYVCIAHCRGILWIGGEHYLELHPRETWAFIDYMIISLTMLTRLSTEFVIIFFVLSGFSIAHSLRNNKQVLPFYKRRFIRLYPPYITAIFWAMLVFMIIGSVYPSFTDGTYQTPAFDRIKDTNALFSWKVFLQNLVYLPQLDGFLQPFWSLTMEVIFYLLAPFLFRNKKWYHLSSITLFLLSMAGKYFQWPVHSIILDFGFYSIFFSIGVALYDHFDWILGKAKIFTKSPALIACTGLFFIMIVVSLLGYKTMNAFLSAAMSAILIIYLLSNNKQVKWLISIGRYSYTLYITHFPTIFLFLAGYYLITQNEPPFIYNPIVFIPCIFVCLGVAYVQYLLIEKRSKGILDRMRRKNKARQEPVLTPSEYEVAKTNW